MGDREELDTLRDRVQDLEGMLAQSADRAYVEEVEVPWWRRFGQVCCSTARAERESPAVAPFALSMPGSSQDGAQSSASFSHCDGALLGERSASPGQTETRADL